MQSGFEKKVEAFIKEQKLILPGDRVLIGLSGGADSACLLVVLMHLAKKLSATFGAFHVNHGIRGIEADEDELFSGELCETFGIPFFSVKEDVPAIAKARKIGLEEAGRELRYQVADRIAKEHNYTKIALAHQQNDVAETLLFHLFRGSSVNGLGSIPAKRGAVIRPLLRCGRDEIETYLKEKGVLFRTDSTNADTEYTRNKIRHRILSYAEKEINEGAVCHVASVAAELTEVEDYLALKTEELVKQAEELPEGLLFPAELLEKEPPVMRRRVIYRWIGAVAGSKKDITKEHVEAVAGLLHAQSGKRISLPYGLSAGRNFDWIFIKKEEGSEETDCMECYMIEIPGEYPLGESGETLKFCTFSYKKNAQIPKNEYTKWFDYDKIRGKLSLRVYCEGDRLGILQGSKTVKSVWVEHKVPIELRKQQLLLADEEQVLWIPGIRCCDNYRIDETTKTVLEVQRNGGK